MKNYQFSLFGWQRPIAKVPISKERIEEVKKLIAKKDGHNAAIALREVRYKLQAFEQRINSRYDSNKEISSGNDSGAVEEIRGRKSKS